MAKTVREMIEVMEAYERGEAVEVTTNANFWIKTDHPYWNWDCHDYRIAPSTPDTINWDHVAPEYKWLARDENGIAYLYDNRPTASDDDWYAVSAVDFIQASAFTSYKRGSVSWDKSLVQRPE